MVLVSIAFLISSSVVDFSFSLSILTVTTASVVVVTVVTVVFVMVLVLVLVAVLTDELVVVEVVERHSSRRWVPSS